MDVLKNTVQKIQTFDAGKVECTECNHDKCNIGYDIIEPTAPASLTAPRGDYLVWATLNKNKVLDFLMGYESYKPTGKYRHSLR
jgi:hypothetical protein